VNPESRADLPPASSSQSRHRGAGRGARRGTRFGQHESPATEGDSALTAGRGRLHR